MENMSNTGLTAGDILALTRDNDGGYGGWFWIIILFIFVFAFSGNMFGGNNASALTTAEYYAGIGNQNLMNDVRTGFSNTAMAQCNTDKEILNNRFTTQVGFQNLGASMDSCCCSIKTAIAEDGEKTRALINAQYQATLLEKINDLKSQISDQNTANYVLNAQGRYVTYPSMGCSCGCSSNLI